MFAWYRADLSLGAGSMAATADSFPRLATCCGINARSPGKQARRHARIVVPNLPGLRRATAISYTTSANSAATRECGKTVESFRNNHFPSALAHQNQYVEPDLGRLAGDRLVSVPMEVSARVIADGVHEFWGGTTHIGWVVPVSVSARAASGSNIGEPTPAAGHGLSLAHVVPLQRFYSWAGAIIKSDRLFLLAPALIPSSHLDLLWFDSCFRLSCLCI